MVGGEEAGLVVDGTGGAACGRCGVSNRAGARFCDSCGTALAARNGAASLETVAAQVPAQVLALALPPDVAPALAKDEVKYVTVLFSDIAGSTEMISDRAPEEAQSRFAPALQAMSEAVRAFGGTVNQLLGDGVMALFGAPVSQEDHAVRACCAALRMHSQLAQLRPPVRLRIGMASGPTLLSSGGADGAGAFQTFGATVHLAARLQESAAPGTTLCSRETARLAGSAATLVPLGRRAIRGLAGQDVFELAAIRRKGLRFGSAVTKGLSPYVGRAGELATLQACAAEAQAGQVLAAALVGEAGAGKSRLANEFVGWCEPQGWQVFQAEALSYGRTFPYHLVTALLRSCFGVQDSDEPAESARRVALQAEALGLPTGAAAAALSSLLNLPIEAGASAWDHLDPQQRRDTMQASVGALLAALAQTHPVVLLIEDLHWADEESVGLIEAVVEDLQASGPGAGLMLMATYRGTYKAGWRRIEPLVIGLSPLEEADMDRLVRAAFPGAFDAVMLQALVTRAAGNPFFMEEMARAAVEVQRDGDGCQTPDGIPATVQAVLAARIDGLRHEDKQVLRTASAFGTRFTAAALQALFEPVSASQFQAQLGRLREAGLLRPDRLADNDEAFAHGLIQEVAYEGMPRDRRRELHSEIVGTLKRLYAERVAEQAETLSYHALRGEVWDELAVHARRAGHRAASRSAFRDAVTFFDQAIDAQDYLPPSPAGMAHRIDLRFELRAALFPTASIARTLACSEEAMRLAGQLGDTGRLGWATAFHARDLTLVGRPGEALLLAAQALELAEGDEELIVVARSYLALAAYSRGDYGQCAAVLGTLVELVEVRKPMGRYRLPGPAAVFFRGWQCWALARMGRVQEAEQVSEAMMRCAERSTQPLCLTVAHLSQGFVWAFAGRLQEARATLEASLALCERWAFFSWFTNIASCLGHVISRLGEPEQGAGLLQHASDRNRASGILISNAHVLAWLAQAHLEAGRAAQARELAAAAVEVAQAHEERGNEALAFSVLAAAEQGGVERAAAYGSALDLARECGMAPLVEACEVAMSGTQAPP